MNSDAQARKDEGISTSEPESVTTRLILASASPRRQTLLSAMGLTFEVMATDVDETVRPGESPRPLVQRLSQSKARAALSRMNKRARCDSRSPSANVWIIAADTIVVAPDDRSVLGKPTTREQAREMLRILRGKRHRVYSGLTLLDAQSARECTLVASTGVHMRTYSDDELAQYVESGDPMDKAGAYAIQHEDFAPIEHLDNCYANVMGLPMCHLYSALKAWYAQQPESAPTMARMRHPLTCCPYATRHGGCPWADSILTPENRTAPV